MKSCLKIVCLFALFCVVCTLSEDEEDKKLINECQKKTKASDADLKVLDDDKEMPNSRTQYCLLACYYKGTKIMDENNKMIYEQTLVAIEDVKEESKETYDKLKKILKDCSDTTLPDKDECDSVKKYLECVTKKAKDMGVDY